MLAAPEGSRARRCAPWRTQATTGQPGHPALPAQWVTAYTRSPRCTGRFGHRRLAHRSQGLIPASGDRDNTTSPSASSALRPARRCVHRIPPPTFVTIAKRPSCMERDGWRWPWIYEKRKLNIFAGKAW